jgi:hypothetical protein
MEIIQIPEEHALIELSSIEIRALWQVWGSVVETMDEEQFAWRFNMTKDHAWDINRKLSEALRLAQENVPRD